MTRRRLAIACTVVLAAVLTTGGVWMSRVRREDDAQERGPGVGMARRGPVDASDSCDAMPAPRRDREELAKELGGQVVLAVLENPDRASAIRTRRFRLIEPGATPDAYTAFGERVSIGPDARSRLSSTLTDDRSWEFDARAGWCMSHYAVHFQFERGGHVVNLVLSFGSHTSVTFLDGVYMSYQNPDPAAKRLIGIARELFPDDEQLRLLETRRFGCIPWPDGGVFWGEDPMSTDGACR